MFSTSRCPFPQFSGNVMSPSFIPLHQASCTHTSTHNPRGASSCSNWTNGWMAPAWATATWHFTIPNAKSWTHQCPAFRIAWLSALFVTSIRKAEAQASRLSSSFTGFHLSIGSTHILPLNGSIKLKHIDFWLLTLMAICLVYSLGGKKFVFSVGMCKKSEEHVGQLWKIESSTLPRCRWFVTSAPKVQEHLLVRSSPGKSIGAKNRQV